MAQNTDPVERTNENTEGSLIERLRREWMSLVIIGLSLATALYYYPRVPALVPSLWSGTTSMNDFNSRAWAVFFPVGIITVLTILFVLHARFPDRRTGAMSLWRARPWVRSSLMAFLWWTQYLTLDLASRPIRKFTTGHVIGSIGIVLFLSGIALGDLLEAQPPGSAKESQESPFRRAALGPLRWLLMVGGLAAVGLTLAETM